MRTFLALLIIASIGIILWILTSAVLTIAAIVGLIILWFLRHELKTHHHDCPKCTHTWSHRGIIARWQEKSHNCPKCGTEQYLGYFWK